MTTSSLAGPAASAARVSVLVVDDDPAICDVCADFLARADIPCVTTSSPLEGLGLLAVHRDINLVIVDVEMPRMNGFEFVAAARDTIAHTLAFIVVTGHASAERAIDSLRLGVTDFLRKPIKGADLRSAVERARAMVARWDADRSEKAYLAEGARTAAAHLSQAYADTVRCLGITAEYKDEETGQHSQRIGAFAARLARELGWPEERVDRLALAAPLHDLGKIGVPECVLRKNRGLSEGEVASIREHARIGWNILMIAASHPVMALAAEIALRHHERYDGTGYPDKIAGDAILPEGRVTAVCDVYDALRSARPYKPQLSHDQAKEIILKGDGRTLPQHFDPMVLDAFARCDGALDEIWRGADFVRVRGARRHQPSDLPMSCIEHMLRAEGPVRTRPGADGGGPGTQQE